MLKHHSLRRLEHLGQSIWLDFVSRGMLDSGELRRYIEDDGVTGVTSNPSIFEKAIGGSHDYDASIRSMALSGKSIEAMYIELVVDDIRRVADLLQPVYDRSGGEDGYVSLEVSPHLAHNTSGTIAEAHRLWNAVDRPNLMIKVPGTNEGLPAIRQLIADGINVNITLLFGLPRYRQVAEAYIAGLNDRSARGDSIRSIASVASFFLSRIDVLLDPLLEQQKTAGPSGKQAVSLTGKTAIAHAKLAYQIYREKFGEPQFKHLAAQGARTQRLLWASTSTKNPEYSDVKYIEPLIGRETVNTLPSETLAAYRDHGKPALTLENDVDEARRDLEELKALGYSIDTITQQLEDEGVRKFEKAFDLLMATLQRRRDEALLEAVDQQNISVGEYKNIINQRLEEMKEFNIPARLWQKDPDIWKNNDKKGIRDALGWLYVVQKMETHLPLIADFVSEIRKAGFRHVVHMGMGGSSLAPLVFQKTFPALKDGIPLTVLDTTDPSAIVQIERSIPLDSTLFIVATKSGTTTEPMAFLEYFLSKVHGVRGDRVGEQFVAITDPGTPLIELSNRYKFRRVILNFADVGGRYSALSFFGLVPAALLGIDVEEVLMRASRMVHACGPDAAVNGNPGVVLGTVIGELARRGRDKLTILTPPVLEPFSLWLEQLIAESTGKSGMGIIPVTGEPVGPPSDYSDDRLFVAFQLASQTDASFDEKVAAIRNAGQPIISIDLQDLLDLGQEFFRWEIATAIAGSILNINPFDQPNVQESKSNTEKLLSIVRSQGELPEEKPVLVEGALSLFATESAPTIGDTLEHFFNQAHHGDYVAIQAYLTENAETQRLIEQIRLCIRERFRLATTAGYGPRYLHSTGQIHKGGPNTGLFLQLTADDKSDIPIPLMPYTFGILKQAQALGDLTSLRAHQRRVIRIHLGSDAHAGLAQLDHILHRVHSGGVV